MKYASIFSYLVVALILAPINVLAQDISLNTKEAIVFIGNYNEKNDFIGWGTGFFVDEGIIVTNKHVIEWPHHYKITATHVKDCSREIAKSNVKINLDDDVAYMRVFLPCEHGVVQFDSKDPVVGDAIGVLGFPVRNTLEESMTLSIHTGSVTGTTDGPWLHTDAYLQAGNSGGPVVKNGKVVGVAVAKTIDAEGNFLSGLFVPVSVIVKGLLYANDSSFAYTPQKDQDLRSYDVQKTIEEPVKVYTPFDPPTVHEHAIDKDCIESLGPGGESTGYGGCRCRGGYHKDDAETMCLPNSPYGNGYTQKQVRNRNVTPMLPIPVVIPNLKPTPSSVPNPASSSEYKMYSRVCPRVIKRFEDNEKMWQRVNTRILSRFGFECSL